MRIIFVCKKYSFLEMSENINENVIHHFKFIQQVAFAAVVFAFRGKIYDRIIYINTGLLSRPF